MRFGNPSIMQEGEAQYRGMDIAEALPRTWIIVAQCRHAHDNLDALTQVFDHLHGFGKLM